MQQTTGPQAPGNGQPERRADEDRDPPQLNDLFGCSVLFQRMFDVWLGSTGLTVFDTNGNGAVGLTDEGWSVLQMLTATRPYDVRRNGRRAR